MKLRLDPRLVWRLCGTLSCPVLAQALLKFLSYPRAFQEGCGELPLRRTDVDGGGEVEFEGEDVVSRASAWW